MSEKVVVVCPRTRARAYVEEVLAELDTVELAGFVGPWDPAWALAREHGVPWYRTFREAERTCPDVIVLDWPDDGYPEALRVIRNAVGGRCVGIVLLNPRLVTKKLVEFTARVGLLVTLSPEASEDKKALQDLIDALERFRLGEEPALRVPLDTVANLLAAQAARESRTSGQ